MIVSPLDVVPLNCTVQACGSPTVNSVVTEQARYVDSMSKYELPPMSDLIIPDTQRR